MGAILSWFRKPNTKQLLQDIQEELDTIEDRQRDVQQRTRRIGRWVVYTFALYLVVGLFTYWYWLPRTLQDRLIYAMPFAAFPPLVMMGKRLLHWYYGRQLRNTRGQVERLKQRKRDILDQVMETETYKVAKEILQQYAPEQLTPGLKAGVFVTPGPSISSPSAGTAVRRRDMTAIRPLVATPARGPRPLLPVTPGPAFTPRGPGAPLYTPRAPVAGATPRGVPMPRPVAPRERGVMDRLIDYMMKEGPNNSYALVCRQCETHNGMALKEDFPYMAYRCAYCYFWNPARKQRPAPPRLEPLQQPPPPPPAGSDSSSSDDDTSPDDSEEEGNTGPEKLEGALGASDQPSGAIEEKKINEESKSGGDNASLVNGGDSDRHDNEAATSSAAAAGATQDSATAPL